MEGDDDVAAARPPPMWLPADHASFVKRSIVAKSNPLGDIQSFRTANKSVSVSSSTSKINGARSSLKTCRLLPPLTRPLLLLFSFVLVETMLFRRPLRARPVALLLALNGSLLSKDFRLDTECDLDRFEPVVVDFRSCVCESVTESASSWSSSASDEEEEDEEDEDEDDDEDDDSDGLSRLLSSPSNSSEDEEEEEEDEDDEDDEDEDEEDECERDRTSAPSGRSADDISFPLPLPPLNTTPPGPIERQAAV